MTENIEATKMWEIKLYPSGLSNQKVICNACGRKRQTKAPKTDYRSIQKQFGLDINFINTVHACATQLT